ncbi:MAG: DivIVA domain-containing protein [Acidimicrobiia bacterium]|nr:DivIVA domain-containing protein [Acidimicrobiia bacterium]
MNALSDLASEVKFRERMRGYDYEEVDSYVKTVNRAAAQAKDRIGELEHRLAQLESQPGSDDGGTEIRETLLRTLVLAQRTADSAVSEARSEAKSITDSAKERAAKTVSEAETAANERLRSAEERAARMLADSEESGQLIIAEAKRTAATELASERERAQGELRDLEASRSQLETVVAEIQARLDSERDMLRSLAVSFQSFAEKFEPVTGITESVGEPEAGESAVAADADADDRAAAADDAGTGGDGAEALEASEDEQAPPSAAGDTQVDRALDADPEPAGGPALEFLPASEGTARAPGGALEEARPAGAVDAGTVPDLPVVEWADEAEHDPSEDIDTAEPEPVASDVIRLEPSAGGNGSASREPDDSLRGDEVASAGPATMPFGVDSPELFDMDAEEDDEFIEQLRQVVSSDAPLPDGDAAMAAFFDHDDGGGRLGPRA